MWTSLWILQRKRLPPGERLPATSVLAICKTLLAFLPVKLSRSVLSSSIVSVPCRYSIARHVQKHARLIAVVEALDNGKPIRETRDADVQVVARHIYHYAGWAQVQFLLTAPMADANEPLT